jgi:hypothetical protein
MGNLGLYINHARNRPRRPGAAPVNQAPPVDLGELIAGLSGPERELFEERAATMEIDGGLSRQAAELEALKAILAGRT